MAHFVVTPFEGDGTVRIDSVSCACVLVSLESYKEFYLANGKDMGVPLAELL